ncbi:MAG: hypothetical protein JSS09_04930, partial [Verrucomicrobia bacterium]|nr:hypothetical protein [Verrucomicrobiota bacterium]
MNSRLFITMCTISTLCLTPCYTDNNMPPMTQPVASQALADALYKIGVSTSDIGQLGISGIPPESLVKTFTKYANNSNEAKFDILSQSDRNALVFFGFKLQSKGAISDSAMKSLMVAEKMRTQMPKAQIKEIMDLVERI